MSRPVKPGPIVIPDTAEIKLHWDVAGQPVTNVLHGDWTQVGPVNPALPETLFSAFKTAFSSTTFNAELATSTAFVGVSFKDIRFAYQAEYMSSGASAAGTDATGAVPANGAIVVTKLTELAGRQWRGRVYFAGLGLTVVLDARHHTVSSGSKAIAFMDGIKAAMQTNNCPMVIGQRELLEGQDSNGNLLPARPAGSAPVTAFKVSSNRIDTQRRRLGR